MKKETYGFKSERMPPSDPDIASFEEELMRTAVNVKFKNKDVMKPNKLQKTINEKFNF